MALKDLTPAQRELAELISELSERKYRAGWMSGIERELWDGVQGVGLAPAWLMPEEAQRLRALSARCGGWIAFDTEREETFVPLAEWEERLAEGT